MHDIKFLRANADLVKQHLANKNIQDGVALVDEVLQLDEQRRNALFEVEQLKKQRNEASQQVAKLKKSGEDATQIIEETRHLGDRIGALDADAREVDAVLATRLLEIPNVHAPDVPIGAVEDDNVEVRKWGEIPQFSFEPKPHWEIGENLRIIDFERGAKISGSRFYVLRGAGARLERALITLMLDVHTQQHGYEEILPPFLVRPEAMTGAGVLPKFGEDAYHVERDDLWLIPTAEVPVTALHNEEILDVAQLPIKYAAYSACFRSEAGAAGRDTRGLIRVHQFNKVELVKFVAPEYSYDELEKLTRDAEVILEMLELPYRTVEHCTGDLGFKATKAYDVEVWLPAQNTYREISSCSNFEAFQARRSGIRYRPLDENGKAGKPEFVHTLNGSGLAIGRTMAAILENFQQSDGTVRIPAALRPYLGGLESIS
ncbi:MAG TPA: serine--tRNA ligase [Abditibacteriaceae bacterium]|jgi:seryl-tRNA synthetase